MKTRLVCNFAVVRFLPYPETEEFVNVGIVLACAQTRTFDFRIETRRRDRITHFFPEMEAAVFGKGRLDFLDEMRRLKKMLGENTDTRQRELNFSSHEFVEFFRQIVAPRESLFRFSGIGTVLTDDVDEQLNALFKHYVERQFATRDEYQEKVMARRLTEVFRAKDVLRHYRKKKIGDEDYHVAMPFVHEVQEKVRKAIKPLNLDKPNCTQILEHGDGWRNRIIRLRDRRFLPDEVLFVIRQAPRGKRNGAAHEVCSALEDLGVHTILETSQEDVLEFAKVE
ncbi:MAG: DUF3037 domain-containing protein [Lentisphaeria bacterium]|nr:DUF3037 domain-containing protein [Lentisphaeria bacterium]